ncbi:TraB/GumN family protein [Duganella radicis]|uniref:TraB/GumN family protein n=1 Tax=Duganella radicis TaxID=551988 RepID=A0A6L6PBF4_9BURK|nr:TraB/GumN family protein [Duganella radicis]MTV36153.1 TraB/GumN family protein [Duganella radicis]
MRLRLLAALCLTLNLSAALAQTEAAPPAEPAAEAAPETILLVGQRPGPGLWKVSKGDHVLWVFGTYSPLPQKMEWRSQQVETILAQTQEYLGPPGASAHVGFFRGLTLLPSLIGLKKNPDGAALKDVLPPEVYARWQPLKAKYLADNDDVEQERPIFAAEALYSAGLKQAGLSQGGEVEKKIAGIAKQRKIKQTATVVDLEIDNASKMVKDFKKSQLADAACLDKTLARLETDIDAMRVRANAWAKGDIEVIQKLKYPDQERECADAMTSGEFARNTPAFQNVKQRVRDAWLAAAEKSLAANTSTFATVRMSYLLGPDSLLAALKTKGYQVDSPE